MVKVIGKIDISDSHNQSESKFDDIWEKALDEQLQRKWRVEELYQISELSLEEIEKLSDEELIVKIEYYTDLKIKKEEKEAEEERQRFIARVKQTRLIDMSDDDSSLNPSFW